MAAPRHSSVLALAVLLVTAGLPARQVPQAEPSPGATELVSAAADGTAQRADQPAVSADGTQVAFESRAALDPAVGAGPEVSNIYVRDRRHPARTVLISRAELTTYRGGPGRSPVRAAAAEHGGNADSLHATISGTGRYVAFETSADDLRDGHRVPDRRIVVCDRDPDGDGSFDELRPDGLIDFSYLTVGAPATGGFGPAVRPSLSADAGTLAWLEEPAPARSSPAAEVVVTRIQKDETGRLLPPDPAGFLRPLTELEGAIGSPDPPQVSGQGDEIVFTVTSCSGSCPVPPATTIQGYDLRADRLRRLDLLPDGTFSGRARSPSVTRSARRIAFEHLGADQPVGIVVDRDTAGAPAAARTIARADDGGTGRAPALSADGSVAALTTGTGGPAVVGRDLVVDANREQAGLPPLPDEPIAVGGRGVRLSADGTVAVYVAADDAAVPGAVLARTFRPEPVRGTGSLGRIEVGTTVSRTVGVAHRGFGPFGIREVRIESGEFAAADVDTCTGAVLRPADSCSIAVTVTPSAVGERRAALYLTLTDGRTAVISLRAEGNKTPVDPPPVPPTRPAAGELEVDPSTVEFPGLSPVLTWSTPRTVRVRNGTAGPVSFRHVALLEGPRFVPGDFGLLSSTCTGVLAAGATCTITIRTSPQGGGTRTGALDLRTDDPVHRKLVQLRSRAPQPVLQASPAVIRPNRVLSVKGSGFPPGQEVEFGLVAGVRLAATTVAGPTGSVAAQLVVFPQTSPGTWPVVATVGPIRAETPILVVPGSYQPPGFTGRR